MLDTGAVSADVVTGPVCAGCVEVLCTRVDVIPVLLPGEVPVPAAETVEVTVAGAVEQPVCAEAVVTVADEAVVPVTSVTIPPLLPGCGGATGEVPECFQ